MEWVGPKCPFFKGEGAASPANWYCPGSALLAGQWQTIWTARTRHSYSWEDCPSDFDTFKFIHGGGGSCGCCCCKWANCCWSPWMVCPIARIWGSMAGICWSSSIILPTAPICSGTCLVPHPSVKSRPCGTRSKMIVLKCELSFNILHLLWYTGCVLGELRQNIEPFNHGNSVSDKDFDKDTDQAQDDNKGLTGILSRLPNDLKPPQRFSVTNILYSSTWKGNTQLILQELE